MTLTLLSREAGFSVFEFRLASNVKSSCLSVLGAGLYTCKSTPSPKFFLMNNYSSVRWRDYRRTTADEAK